MDQSPLFKLSAELRNQVYQLVAEDPKSTVTADLADADKPRVSSRQASAMTMTSRQMRSECQALCKANTTVRIVGPKLTSGQPFWKHDKNMSLGPRSRRDFFY